MRGRLDSFKRKCSRDIGLLLLTIVLGLVCGTYLQQYSSYIFPKGKNTLLDNLYYEPQSKQVCDELSAMYNFRNMDTMSNTTCEAFKKHCNIQNCTAMLDIVFLWVNSSDFSWSNERERVWSKVYSTHQRSGNGNSRFREFGQLKYAIRSIEKNVPFARRIFIVTKQQFPSYLNLEHPRLRIIDHNDLMQDKFVKGYPLFNSIAIQIMVGTIPTLSSPFLYLEDDIFIKRPARIEDFFRDNRSVYDLTKKIDLNITKTDHQTKQGYRVLKSIKMMESKGYNLLRFFSPPKGDIFNNTVMTVTESGHFGKMVELDLDKQLAEMFPGEYQDTLNHPFRHPNDFSYWNLLAFSDPNEEYYEFDYSAQSYYNVINSNNIDQVFQEVYGGDWLMVCLNDDFGRKGFTDNSTLAKTHSLYEGLFPEKCSFEI